MVDQDKSKYKILLVEDDFINGKIVKTLLEKATYQVDWVKNGKEALDKLDPDFSDYSLVLMDIQMPIINGYEVSTTLRENGIKIPIVSMTANAFCDEKTKSKEAGMNDCISKPVTKIELFEVIEKCL